MDLIICPIWNLGSLMNDAWCMLDGSWLWLMAQRPPALGSPGSGRPLAMSHEPTLVSLGHDRRSPEYGWQYTVGWRAISQQVGAKCTVGSSHIEVQHSLNNLLAGQKLIGSRVLNPRLGIQGVLRGLWVALSSEMINIAIVVVNVQCIEIGACCCWKKQDRRTILFERYGDRKNAAAKYPDGTMLVNTNIGTRCRESLRLFHLIWEMLK